MLKIALDARMINKSGIGTYIKHIINSGYQVILGNPSDGATIPFFAKNYSIKEQLFFPYKKLRREKIDVLHVPHLNIPVFYKGKLVITIHDLTHLKYPQFLPSKFHYFYFRFMIGLACKKASKILTVSENTKKDIIEFFNVKPDKISVTPLAAGKEFVHKNKSEVCYLQKKYRIPGAKKIILYVGNLLPHKNLNALLKAFDLLKNKDECCLVLVGKIFENRLKLNIEEQSVICTGSVSQEELVDFYNLSDLFVFPSLYEGFGLPVLESLACGTPVACSNTSSLPEVGGNFAFYFDPENELDIANKIEAALNTKTNSLELCEYSRKFSWKKTAQATIHEINTLVH
ncbi:MAG: glycosyltransferase family 4 protein [Fibrobacter sp.]|jgi:glycosyltransferase involved in cell wall biosynthesis|nr:glycosyltransferase family 4 protein [Fibrobacter sp.]